MIKPMCDLKDCPYTLISDIEPMVGGIIDEVMLRVQEKNPEVHPACIKRKVAKALGEEQLRINCGLLDLYGGHKK